MFSEENEKKIIETGLYKHDPDVKLRGTLYKNDLYWCCNWTFRPSKMKDDTWRMQDTYWCGSGLSIELTDENFNEFSLIFDFNDVKEISNPQDYDNSDLYLVSIDSGGYQFAKHFIKRDAKPSQEKMIGKCKEEIHSCERELERLKDNLQELEAGTHWKLQ